MSHSQKGTWELNLDLLESTAHTFSDHNRPVFCVWLIHLVQTL
jgi:hypothetical protein